MVGPMLRPSIRFALLGGLMIGLTSGAGAAPQATKPPVNANAALMQDFLRRVDKYVVLHQKAEGTLPRLPAQTSPQQIDAHQRALGKLIQEARNSARPGDIFTPGMQRFLRSMLRPIFAGPDGLQIKNEIMDKEYKGSVKLVVNSRYPDDVPVSTMPPQVLVALSKLPEELEYRFIQNTLILFDPHSHLIVDYMVRAF
jgi:hypothetical protein